MSQFPVIRTLSDISPAIESNHQIRVKVDDSTGHTVVCYMVQDEDTFSGDSPEIERECRGITFDSAGNIAARTMHKFFNVGERPETMPDQIDWSKVDRIMEKRDGSMVTPVLTPLGPSRFKFKTKKTFTSPESICADQQAVYQIRYDWIVDMLEKGLTPTFEMTSPRFPIVVMYSADELTLLHIREMVSGRYLTAEEIVFTHPPFPVVENMVAQFCSESTPSQVQWEKLRVFAETATGMEGVVIQFHGGEMMKLKTAWYISLHHSVVFTRWRDVARTVCADQADDLKAAFTMVGRSIEPILKVERRIMSEISNTQNSVEEQVKIGRALDWSIKDMALALRDHPLFPLIIREFKGQEVDYMEHYVKNYLDDGWSLEVIPAV